jgi:hypothetical protein
LCYTFYLLLLSSLSLPFTELQKFKIKVTKDYTTIAQASERKKINLRPEIFAKSKRSEGRRQNSFRKINLCDVEEIRHGYQIGMRHGMWIFSAARIQHTTTATSALPQGAAEVF